MKTLSFCILLLSFSVFSQNIVFDLDTNYLRIGERFNLTVKSLDVDSNNVFWNDLDSLLMDFELLNQPVLFNYQDSLFKKFVLTRFDTGQFVLPGNQFINNYNDVMISNNVVVNFLSVDVDTTRQFFDIKPAKEIPFLFRELVYYVPQILVVVFMLLLWFYFLFKYRQKDLGEEFKEKEPIDVFFLNKIKGRKLKDYLDNDNYTKFYTDLSLIFRSYLEARFGFNALDSDSQTLKSRLKKNNLSENWFNTFFRYSDLVKFAQASPTTQESLQFLESIVLFIKSHGVKPLEDEEIREMKLAHFKKQIEYERYQKIYAVILFVLPLLLLCYMYIYIIR